MRIIVLSDTHIPITTKSLPKKIIEELRISSLCLHCGDFVDISVVEEISKYVKLIGVRGNMDSPQVQKTFPDKQVITVEDIKIGLIHGGGSPFNILERVKKELGPNLDIYIFGHTHSPYNEICEGKIFFNPGSPTDKVFAKSNSYGILNVEAGEIKREIVKI